MRRIAMIGFALATVSVLLAGCAAESSQEPLYTTVDTPYYDVMLPTSLFSSFAVDYDDSYRLDGDTGEGIGFCVSVCDEGTEEPLWYVLCATSSYGPAPGFPRTVDKGAPSAWPAARVSACRGRICPIRRSRPRSRLRPLRRREVVALPRMFHVKQPFVCAACCRIGLPIGECRAVPDRIRRRCARRNAFRDPVSLLQTAWSERALRGTLVRFAILAAWTISTKPLKASARSTKGFSHSTGLPRPLTLPHPTTLPRLATGRLRRTPRSACPMRAASSA